VRSCCRLAALLDIPLSEAAQHIVPVAVTAGESIERLRSWASGRCLSADRPGIYTRGNDIPGKVGRNVRRDPSSNWIIGPVSCSARWPDPGLNSTCSPPTRRRAEWSVAAPQLGGSMTTLLDHLETRTTTINTTTPAQRLRATMAAVRVHFHWMGTQKTLSPEQKAQAAQAFDAEAQYLSAAKRVLDTKHSAFRAVTAARGKIENYWRGLSLPFPEPGIRLIRQEQLEEFAATMADYQRELDDAVANLDRHYAELKQAAARRLGSLFSSSDYPETLVGLFGVEFDFPSLEPPDYLVQLAPGLYEQERARVAARFEEAVQLAEQAFLDEFARLVAHLCERVSDDGGEGKIFRDSAVTNLSEFFARFRALNVRSNAQLEELVERAQRAVRGVGAQDLRDSGALRRRVTTELSRVQTALDDLLVDRPRRRILRQAPSSGGE
jgi:hypothetical protein